MKKIQRISESEWQIMKLFWENSPQTAKYIIEKLSSTTSWSPNTIKTLINRLVKKQALNFEKKGKIYFYSPQVSKSECVRLEKKSVADKLFNGEINNLIKAFIEDEEFTPDEIKELTDMLKRKAEKDDNDK